MIAPRTKLLSDYVRDDYAVCNDLKPSSVYQLYRSARIYEEWAGEHAALELINERRLSRCLMELKSKYAAKTLHKIRGDWLTLLKAASDDGYCRRVRRRKIRPIKKPKPRPFAYTPEQAAALVSALLLLPGNLRDGRRRSTYFATFAKTCWESGLRKQDIEGLNQHNFDDRGRIFLTQSKTDEPHKAAVQLDTLQQIRRLGPKPFRILESPAVFWRWWNKGLVAAGLPAKKGKATKAMRISGATDIARTDRAAATKYLGHTTPAADPFYLDERLLGGDPVQPTRLAVSFDSQLTLFQ